MHNQSFMDSSYAGQSPTKLTSTQQFHELFQQLSQVRIELRMCKQENQTLKNGKIGLEEQLEALKDILQQKKSIIGRMSQQIKDKRDQLAQAESQIGEMATMERRMAEQIESVRSRSEQLGDLLERCIEEKNKLGERLQETEKRLMQTERSSMRSQNTLQNSTLLNRVTSLLAECRINIHSTQSRMPPHSLSVSEITNLPSAVTALLSTNQQLVRNNTVLQTELELLRSSGDKQAKRYQEISKQLTESTILLQRKQHQLERCEKELRVTCELVQKLNQERSSILKASQKQLEQLQNRLESQQKQQKNRLQQLSFVRAFLPDGFVNLLQQYTSNPSGHKSQVLATQMNKIASLHLNRLKHLQQIEKEYLLARAQITRLEGTQEVLEIKLSNLEKAYENAIEDYRRALRFGTAVKQNSARAKRYQNSSNKQNCGAHNE